MLYFREISITHVTLVFADVISGIAQEGLGIFPEVNSFKLFTSEKSLPDS
jgi:hypothetical protein